MTEKLLATPGSEVISAVELLVDGAVQDAAAGGHFNELKLESVAAFVIDDNLDLAPGALGDL